MAENFFWDQECNRKIHWIGWPALCKCKKEGGLSFKRLRYQNVASLTKMAWRLAVNPQGLAHQVLRAKYFPTTDFFTATTGSNPSFTWRSIVAARYVLMCGTPWEVGDGTRIKVMGDRGYPVGQLFQAYFRPKIATFICHSLDPTQ
ncbi:UNVERIFIED_CONTAM: hypothetical protein Slati_3438900 [Sesamum latifolium]|uniref:Uncharacterized protein n=1 Tax=Sesamum latifolium TaxID=2727402 RepID=A0AAW2UIL3_9LAMI